jgi:hypothetical protein
MYGSHCDSLTYRVLNILSQCIAVCAQIDGADAMRGALSDLTVAGQPGLHGCWNIGFAYYSSGPGSELALVIFSIRASSSSTIYVATAYAKRAFKSVSSGRPA